MTLYAVKPAFQKLLRPLAYRLADAGVSANAVTVTAMLLSVAVGGGLALGLVQRERWVLLLLPVLLLLRMALNAIDGMIARERDQVSRPGAYLNELGDVISDSALYLPFALLPGGWPAAVFASLAAAGELAGVLGQVPGAGAVAEVPDGHGTPPGGTRRYDGPMGKSDRALWFSLLALLLGFGLGPGLWLTWLLGALCALSVVTLVNRVRKGLSS